MTFDTRQALSIQAARTINVGRGSGGGAPVDPSGALFYENFEAQTVDQSPTGGNSFLTWGNGTRTKTLDDRSYTGTKALRFRFPGDPDPSAMAMSEQRFTLGSQETEMWWRYKLWIPANYQHRIGSGANNNKGLLMLWSQGYSSGPTVSLHFGTPNDFVDGTSASNPNGSVIYAAWRQENGVLRNFYNENNLSENHKNNMDPTKGIRAEHFGQWNDIVVHVKAATNDAPYDGAVQAWVNDESMYNVTNATNYFPSNNYWDEGYLLGWANSGFDEETDLYIDDILIGRTSESINFTVPV